MASYFAFVLIAPVLGSSIGAAPDDPTDPPYAVNQCDNPIAIVDARTTMPDHPDDGQHWWRGKCVTAEFRDWGSNCTGVPCGATRSYNIRVAKTMPNPGTCSATAEKYNGGTTPPHWDFSGAGYCGVGDCKNLLTSCTWDVQQTAAFHHGRLACFAHDACVWARCEDDALRPNFIVAMGGVDSMIDAMLSGDAADELRKGDSVCGAALYDTMTAYYDASNKRIARFFKKNPQYKQDGSNWPPATSDVAFNYHFI